MGKEFIIALLMLLSPDDWCQSDLSTQGNLSVWACKQMSDLNKPYTHKPTSCFQADESEEVLQCCVWRIDDSSGCSKIDDEIEGPIYELWCVDFEDPCRKWLYDGITDDLSIINSQ